MESVILFLNSFLSYLLLMAVIVVLAGVAIFIGIRLRKNKDRQLGSSQSAANPFNGICPPQHLVHKAKYRRKEAVAAGCMRKDFIIRCLPRL